MRTDNVSKIELIKTKEEELDTFFLFQLDKEAYYLAAFTSGDQADKTAYLQKWTKLLSDETINMQTILLNGEIVGSIVKYETAGNAEITYWIGKAFWGQGIATRALQMFLLREKVRPIFGRVAFDNYRSQKVLEKNSFIKIGTDRGFANARGVEIEEYIFKLTATV